MLCVDHSVLCKHTREHDLEYAPTISEISGEWEVVVFETIDSERAALEKGSKS